MKQKLFDLQCAECRKVFRNPDEKERFCPEGKKIKEKRKIKPIIREKKSLYQIAREIEQYNKEHKTGLSYGRYIALVDN